MQTCLQASAYIRGGFMFPAIRCGTFSTALILNSLVFWSAVSAAPAPGNAEGVLVPGGEVVVTGSGFGSKDKPEPIIFDTQDKVWINGVLSQPYAGLSHGDAIPTGGNNPWLSGGTGVLRGLWLVCPRLRLWTACRPVCQQKPGGGGMPCNWRRRLITT